MPSSRKLGYTVRPMDPSPSSVRNLARRLLSAEATTNGVNTQRHEAVRVCEKLGISLTRFAGPDGFASLMRRALALAIADSPSLATVTLNPDGSLEGIEPVASDTQNGGPEAAVGIIAHLLGLLVAFIGEPLTLRLVRETWPDASLDD